MIQNTECYTDPNTVLDVLIQKYLTTDAETLGALW